MPRRLVTTIPKFHYPSAFCLLRTAMVYVSRKVCGANSSLTWTQQRMVELTVIARGGSLGYWTGDPLRLLEDIQILKPNIFPAVPRVLNRIYQAGMAATQLPGVKGALFRRALDAKLQRLATTGSISHPLWDRLVFKKVGLFFFLPRTRRKCVSLGRSLLCLAVMSS